MTKALHKILYIDDDNDIRMVASMILERGGLEVISMPSGQRALEYIAEQDENALPDMILLDVMMPVMDGPQTLAAIKALAPHPISETPIVFLTAKCQPEQVELLLGLGAGGVIAKPFDVSGLLEQVHQKWEELS